LTGRFLFYRMCKEQNQVLNMKRYAGIIFDMDGLMIDSEPLQLKAVNEALKPLGIFVNETDFIDMVGKKSIENFSWLKDKYGFAEPPESLEQKKNRAYLSIIQRELKPMPGLFQAIESCKRKGLELAIASSSVREDIDIVLKILGLANTFGVVASGDEVKKGKPDPEIFLKAAEKMEKDPSCLIVLEDTGFGVDAAKAAGMYCIAIPNGFTLHHDFSKADMVLNSLLDLNLDGTVNLAAEKAEDSGQWAVSSRQ